MMTYRELRDYLNSLSEVELDLNVSIYSGDVDEVWPVMSICRNNDADMGEEMDVLDPNHPLLIMS